MKKERILKKLVSMLLMMTLVISLTSCSSKKSDKPDEIKLGMLFDFSGSMVAFDTACYNGAKLAIKEINEAGGIKGAKIVTVEEDYASDVTKTMEKAKKLILEDKVVATVGGAFTFYAQSEFEQDNGLLLYPIYYQGEIDYDNMVTTGFVPNQQSFYLLDYLLKNVGKSYYLLGSDYEYPLVSFNQAKKIIGDAGGSVVGEEYVPLGDSDFSSVLNKIKEAHPDVVYTAFAGESLFAFHKQLEAIGWDFNDIKIASLTLDDMCCYSLPVNGIAGTYVSFPYLTAIDTPANKEFVAAYLKEYGADSYDSLCEGTEESYTIVKMLAKALEKTDDYSTEGIMKAFKGIEIETPAGKVKMDEDNLHTWYTPIIGQVNSEGKIGILETGDSLVQPEPWSKLLYPDGAPK